jgi:hypothetical protein
MFFGEGGGGGGGGAYKGPHKKNEKGDRAEEKTSEPQSKITNPFAVLL